MKRSILLILHIVFFSTAFAQRPTNLDDVDIKSDTLYMGDYAYVCDTLMNLGIYYYNLDNHPGRGDVRYKTGEPRHLEEILADKVKHVVISDAIHELMHSIVDNAFSKEQAALLEGKKFSIVLNISSSDGTITDVYFKCWATDGYKSVPIEVFREIEVRLKNEVQFTLTEEGKKMNYCFLAWSQCPKGRAEESASETEEGADGGTTSGNNNSLQTDLGGAVTDRGTTSGGGLATPTLGGLVTP